MASNGGLFDGLQIVGTPSQDEKDRKKGIICNDDNNRNNAAAEAPRTTTVEAAVKAVDDKEDWEVVEKDQTATSATTATAMPIQAAPLTDKLLDALAKKSPPKTETQSASSSTPVTASSSKVVWKSPSKSSTSNSNESASAAAAAAPAAAAATTATAAAAVPVESPSTSVASARANNSKKMDDVAAPAAVDSRAATPPVSNTAVAAAGSAASPVKSAVDEGNGEQTSVTPAPSNEQAVAAKTAIVAEESSEEEKAAPNNKPVVAEKRANDASVVAEEQEKAPATPEQSKKRAIVETAIVIPTTPLSSTTAAATNTAAAAAAAPTPTSPSSQLQRTVLSSTTTTRSPDVILAEDLRVHESTPIPNSDVSIRLLRKFASKTGPFLPSSSGGTQSSIFSIFTGPSKEPALVSYSKLMDALKADEETSSSSSARAASKNRRGDDANVVVESILGGPGATMSKARTGIACFIKLLDVWCHVSNAVSETKPVVTPDLLSIAIDTTQGLVAHGCLDGVLLVKGAVDDKDRDKNKKKEDRLVVKAANVMAESVFCADLGSERTELSALKFLLTAGCRVVEVSHASTRSGAGPEEQVEEQPDVDDVLLRGTHLLQTIRVCYHIYLKTASGPNKTTARASLQQMITSVFNRMKSTDISEATPTSDHFPSRNHRDAFLVLRSLCKLSMRSLQQTTDVVSSSMMWGTDAKITEGAATATAASDAAAADATNAGTADTSEGGAAAASTTTTTTTAGRKMARVPSMDSSAVAPLSSASTTNYPALDSKILALEFLLYVLEKVDMSGDFLQNSGPQFQYAIRNYLCVSLLKNSTSENTTVVNLSLRLFVPLLRHFRSHLKTEIEAFVTNVFFVILDSQNSTLEHKSLVVTLFEEICSDPATLAEIFLNYDCDLSAVDLFHRIVNTLSRVAKLGINERELMGGSGGSMNMSFVAGAGAARLERLRQEHRELRLDAMRALRQVLASLHSSIVTPMKNGNSKHGSGGEYDDGTGSAGGGGGDSSDIGGGDASPQKATAASPKESGKQSLVDIYDSKKKRRAEESEAVLRFNQKPSAGIKYAAKCGHLDGEDPAAVARYLLANKEVLDKTQIGDYLGREPEYQKGFCQRVLYAYVDSLDFNGLPFDDAIRYFLSGFRLPGEAQKIDRIMEKFAERYTLQNPSVFPTADAAFILAFSIIMLNTDLHNPAIKEERRMTKEGFIRNNRGICDGQDLPDEFLNSVFDRIKSNPISLKEDDEARERAGEGAKGDSVQAVLSPAVFFGSHYVELDKERETNFQKERDQIVRNTESLFKRKKRHDKKDGHHGKHHSGKSGSRQPVAPSLRFVSTKDTGLRDEYVSPMFEVTWAPALAAFSVALESANGSVGVLSAIATDEEMEMAAENAAEVIEVCLTGFRLAICTAGLCGNDTARDAFMLALLSFSQLGTGRLMEQRHLLCAQVLLNLGLYDGELLGNTWEHVFKALSEVHRLHQRFHASARSNRAAAARHQKMVARHEQIARSESQDASSFASTDDSYSDSDESDELLLEEEMDKGAIDAANARLVYEGISEDLFDEIYHRSSSLSPPSMKEFIFQLCRVSRMEISGYGGHVGSRANAIDLSDEHLLQHHTLVANEGQDSTDILHHNQPNIYSLQKLVEVTHYNMDSRPRLLFQEIWNMVSAHLTSTALHSNAAVAVYAMDSFRQLSIQFLQREELGVFEFQRRFLKPFETVMVKSEYVEIKEHLLNCVEQIISIFGVVKCEDDEDGGTKLSDKRGGTLRSGWRPILALLGLAGLDDDDGVAKTGFKMLTSQLSQCLQLSTNSPSGKRRAIIQHESSLTTSSSSILLSQRFIDLVDALLTYVRGPREEMSVLSIDYLVTLANFLADESIPLPVVRHRNVSTTETGPTEGELNPMPNGTSSQELELWWPILLGLSRSVGDSRKTVQTKSLDALLAIINKHFFPRTHTVKATPLEEETETTPPSHGELQTLQLIFRGVLTPILEHADTDDAFGKTTSPSVPEDFDRFITPSAKKSGQKQKGTSQNWLNTTFDQLIDGCIAICLRSLEEFQSDALVEEVLAIFNSCLLSDSGALAVHGLGRLFLFVTQELDISQITDDTWATVSHMLRRCLSVRGLPVGTHHDSNEDVTTEEELKERDREAAAELNEFVMEERILGDRRYIAGHATKVIGSLLSSSAHVASIGLRWYVFLATGLGEGIAEWEKAAEILASREGASPKPLNGLSPPPHYTENSVYGRKWMTTFLVQLISREDVMQADSETARGESSEGTCPMTKRSINAAQKLVKEQTISFVNTFLEKESIMRAGGASTDSSVNPKAQATEVTHLTTFLSELLAGYLKVAEAQPTQLPWLIPVLSSCIQCNDSSLRHLVHRLTQRLYQEHPEQQIQETVEENKGIEEKNAHDKHQEEIPQEEQQEEISEGEQEDKPEKEQQEPTSQKEQQGGNNAHEEQEEKKPQGEQQEEKNAIEEQKEEKVQEGQQEENNLREDNNDKKSEEEQQEESPQEEGQEEKNPHTVRTFSL